MPNQAPADTWPPAARRPVKAVWHTNLAAALVGFWQTHGVDRTPRERQLYRFARARLGPRANTYNVALILRRLADRGVLAREAMIGQAIEYRLRRAYAFPLWPGYAREAEEFLDGGWVHCWHDGTFSVLGRDPGGDKIEVPLLAADHFYSEFLNYRATLQARLRGLDPRMSDDEQLINAARARAPVTALRALAARATRHREFPAAMRILDQSRFCRTLADANSFQDRPQEATEILGPDLSRHHQVALELLHAVCAHDHLVRLNWLRPVRGDVPPRLAFKLLDEAIVHEIGQRIHALPRSVQRSLESRRPRGVQNVDQWARSVPPAPGSSAGVPITACFARRPRLLSGAKPVPTSDPVPRLIGRMPEPVLA